MADEIDLTATEQALAQGIGAQADQWLRDGHREYCVNTIEQRGIPDGVWKTVVSNAQRAGWNATMRGAIVSIRRP